MFSQFFVQIFALYKFFRKNLRKKSCKFSMDPICVKIIAKIGKKLLSCLMMMMTTSATNSNVNFRDDDSDDVDGNVD